MNSFYFMLRTPEPTEVQIGRMFARTHVVCVEVGAFRRWAAVMVDREAPGLAEAIVRSVADLDHAGLAIFDIGPDDDIVSFPTIAVRIGCPESTVRRWASGWSGPTGFPAPVELPGRAEYYRWKEIVRWIAEYLSVSIPDWTHTFSAANLALRMRRLRPVVPELRVFAALAETEGPGATAPVPGRTPRPWRPARKRPTQPD